MPNQRKKGKKLIAGWIEERDILLFKEIAKRDGMTATDLLTTLVREEIKRSGLLKKNSKKEK